MPTVSAICGVPPVVSTVTASLKVAVNAIAWPSVYGPVVVLLMTTPATVGTAVSTRLATSTVMAACASTASLPATSRMLPSLAIRALRATATPSSALSPATTV